MLPPFPDSRQEHGATGAFGHPTENGPGTPSRAIRRHHHRSCDRVLRNLGSCIERGHLSTTEFLTHLESFIGQPAGPAVTATDEVNLPTIRRWVEAMGDANPIYVDDDAARAAGRDGIVAPPAMLSVWTARGYRATLAEQRGSRSDQAGVLRRARPSRLLRDAGNKLRPDLPPGTPSRRSGQRVDGCRRRLSREVDQARARPFCDTALDVHR